MVGALYVGGTVVTSVLSVAQSVFAGGCAVTAVVEAKEGNWGIAVKIAILAFTASVLALGFMNRSMDN